MSDRIIRSRLLTAGDAPDAAAWINRDFPVPGQLSASLPGLLARLIAEGILRGELVEYLGTVKERRVLAAFGLSAFISEAVAKEYLAAPFPHFELELLGRAYRSNDHPFLDYREVAEANFDAGLVLLPLVWMQRANNLSDLEARALLIACQQSFVRVHRGYRLSRIIKETPADRADAFRAAGFREVCRLPPGTTLRGDGVLRREHVVFEASRDDIEKSLPGAAISHLFSYTPPRAGFTRSEQDVLHWAVEHLTDEEIAKQLGISPSAVALRWRSIYARAAERVPSVFEIQRHSSSIARGKEKRRRVIAFVTHHPEEVRPYPA